MTLVRRLLGLVVGLLGAGLLVGAAGIDPSSLVTASLATVVATSAAIAVASACLVVLSAVSTTVPTGPAPAHRQLTDAIPAPRHPNTVGRRHARAPSSVAVA